MTAKEEEVFNILSSVLKYASKKTLREAATKIVEFYTPVATQQAATQQAVSVVQNKPVKAIVAVPEGEETVTKAIY